MSSFEESIAYARFTNVTKSVTNGRITDEELAALKIGGADVVRFSAWFYH